MSKSAKVGRKIISRAWLKVHKWETETPSVAEKRGCKVWLFAKYLPPWASPSIAIELHYFVLPKQNQSWILVVEVMGHIYGIIFSTKLDE